MGLFNNRIKIGEGQKYDVSTVTNNEVLKEEAVKNNNRLIQVFNFFNTIDLGDSLNSVELAKAMEFFESLDDGDGKLSNSELAKGAEQINKQLELQGKEKVKASDLKEFLKNIINTTQKHEKDDVQTVLANYEKQQKQLERQNFLDNLDRAAQQAGLTPTEREGVYFNSANQQYLKYDEANNQFKPAKWVEETQTFEYMPQEEIQAQTAQEKPQEQEVQEQTKHHYTVQPNETFTSVILKSLKAQGIENPTEEQIKEAKEQFKQDNPNAVKTTRKGYEYLLVGAQIDLRGEVDSPKNSQEAIAQWSQEHPDLVWKPKNQGGGVGSTPAGFDTEGAKEAKAKGYKPSEKTNYYLDEQSGKYYLYDPEKKEFRESKNTVAVYSDGTFEKEFANQDGSKKRIKYGDDGYPREMNAQAPNGSKYDNHGDAAKAMGLQKTFATESKGIYYDPQTKIHYEWDDEMHSFAALDKNVFMVGRDGTYYNKDGKYNDRYQLKKDGTEVYTSDDGSTQTYTYDPKTGKCIKSVYRDSGGNITETNKYTRSSKGKLETILKIYPDQSTSLFIYGKNEKAVLRTNYSKDGHFKSRYSFENGKGNSCISQQLDENGKAIGEPIYYDGNEKIDKNKYDELQK